MKRNKIFSVFVVVALILQLSTFIVLQAAVSAGFAFTITKVTSGESIEYSGVSPVAIYTNGNETLRFTWIAADDETFDIFYESGATDVKINSSAQTRLFDWTGAGVLPEDEFTFFIQKTGGGAVSSSGVVNIDKTAPNQASVVGLFDSDDNSIGNQSNKTNITVKWTKSEDTAPNQADDSAKYRVICRYGSNQSCGADQIVAGVQATFVINPSLVGDNVALTFIVSAIDKAGNENTVTTNSRASFTLNTTAPAAPTNLKVFNVFNEEVTGTAIGQFSRISFTDSTSADVTRFIVRIKKSLSDTTPSVVSSGSNILVYENVLSGITLVNGNDIVVQVIAMDAAGNPSVALERQFRFDNVAPSFELKHNSGVTSISSSGLTLNTVERGTITALSANNDVTSVIIYRGATKLQEYTGSNVLSQTQNFLRAAVTGDYEIIARDAALNRLVFEFTLQVTPPSLSNRSITVTFNDTSPEVGVNGTGVVSFVPATSSDGPVEYQLYIDGRPIGATQGSSGGNITLSFNYRTAVYGNLKLIYEVRAVDASGNFVIYNQTVDYVVIDKVKPYAKILSTSSSSNSIVVQIELRDFYRVLSSFGAKAEVYEGSVLLEEIPLNLGINNYTITSLRAGRNDIKIVVKGTYTYDNVISTNQILNVGSQFTIDTLRLNPDVTAIVTDVVGKLTSVTLTVDSVKNTTSLKTLSVFIYEGKGPLYSGNPLATKEISLSTSTVNSSNELEFTGLVVGKMYHIQVRDGNFILATARVITEYPVPSSRFEIITTKGLEMTLGVQLINSSSANVYLFKGTTLIGNPIPLPQANFNRFNITADIDFNTEYSIKVISNTYNAALEELSGDVLVVPINNAIIGEYTFTTAKETPTGDLPDTPGLLEIIDDEVLFQANIVDPDNALVKASVVLYEGETIIDEIAIDAGRSNLKFSDLKTFTDYIISIHITYDLNDGNGPITKSGNLTPSALTNSFEILRFKTIKALPTAEISTIVATNQTLNVTIQPTDLNNAFVKGTVKIFSLTQASPLRVESLLFTGFQRGTPQTFSFIGLTADTVYRVEVEIDYNLANNLGERTYKPVTQNIRTRQNIGAEIKTITTTESSATIVVDLFDFTTSNVDAKLFLGTTLVGNSQRVVGGANTLLFEGLLPDTQYRVVIDYNNGANLLVARDLKTKVLLDVQDPSLSLIEPVITTNQVTLQIDVKDPDTRVQPNATVIIKNDDGEDQISLSVLTTDLIAGKIVDLPYDNQTVTVYVFFLNENDDVKELIVAAPSIVRLSSIPEPIPEPVIPVTPVEPQTINAGAIVISAVGLLAVGFVGVFVYSFRKLYIQ